MTLVVYNVPPEANDFRKALWDVFNEYHGKGELDLSMLLGMAAQFVGGAMALVDNNTEDLDTNTVVIGNLNIGYKAGMEAMTKGQIDASLEDQTPKGSC